MAVGRVLVWLVVAACAVIFARSIRWGSVRDAFVAADARLLAVAAVLWIGSTAFQGTRWYALVRAVAKPSWRSVLACYYVGQAGSVVLPMRAGEAVRIELQDNGPGMPADVAEHVFDPFYTTKAQGSGLGLAIVRKIVDAHDGQIDLRTAPGSGTLIRVTLPVSVSRDDT